MEIDNIREWITDAASALNANEPDVAAALDALEQAIGWYAAQDRRKGERLADIRVEMERLRRKVVADPRGDVDAWRTASQTLSAEAARIEFELAKTPA